MDQQWLSGPYDGYAIPMLEIVPSLLECCDLLRIMVITKVHVAAISYILIDMSLESHLRV